MSRSVGHDPLFDSAWAKWAQGVKHVHALQDNIGSFNADHDRGPVLEARTEYHAKRHGFIVTIAKVEPIPVLWSLMLGDAANNFRAALDHLAWALAIRGRTPPGTGRLKSREEEAIYFPIYEDRLKYNRSLARKLPGVPRADRALVRRHQPYHQSARTRHIHVLAMLASISSGDKHRTVQPIWVEPSVLHVHLSKSRDCEVRDLRTHRWRKRPLEEDTELAYLPARRTGPHPQIEVQVKVTAEPSIGNRVTFKEWGTRTAAFLNLVLSGFSYPSQKLIESIADIDRVAATAKALEAAEAMRE